MAITQEIVDRTRDYEGSIQHMYLDTRGNVTIGVGHLISSAQAATSLPLVDRLTEIPALANTKSREWDTVERQVAGRVASYYEQFTSLKLLSRDIDRTLQSDLVRFEGELRSNFQGYDQYPRQAQAGLIDMAFNLGLTRLLERFPNFVRAVRGRDWATAAIESHRTGVPEDRNDEIQELFEQAAGVRPGAAEQRRPYPTKTTSARRRQRGEMSPMSCGCSGSKSDSTTSQYANRGNYEENPIAHSYGSVLDNTIGLAGFIEEIPPEEPGTIVVNSISTDGTRIKARLEEGLPGLFTGLAARNFVFTAITVHQRLGQTEIRGVCFWILKFGAPALVSDSDAGSPVSKQERKPEATATPDPDAPLDSFTSVMQRSRPWSAARDNRGVARTIRGIGFAVDSQIEILPAVCIVAAIKATLVRGFFDQVLLLIADEYFPAGFECVPGLPGSTLTGFINVIFRFRNALQDERTIVVSVKLSTWGATDGVRSDGSIVKAFGATRSCYTPRCLACRVACRAAQATAVAACAELSGPAAALCIAAAIEVGDSCYNGCRN